MRGLRTGSTNFKVITKKNHESIFRVHVDTQRKRLKTDTHTHTYIH